MTPLQKAQLKLSTSREAANDLAAKADRTPEEDQKLTELRNKHKGIGEGIPHRLGAHRGTESDCAGWRDAGV